MFENIVKSAALWGAVDAFFRHAFGFIISIILARLLIPDDFGTIALLSIFIGVANLFVNAGLGAAIIQRQDVTHDDESTVFWFNLIIAFSIMVILCLSSKKIAEFFDKTILSSIIILLSFNIFISAFGSIQSTLMTKRLDFKTQMKIGISSTCIGGIIAVYMAWQSYGVWSLVWQTLTTTLISVALLWYFSNWRPARVFYFSSLKKLFAFGGWIFMAWLLDVIYQKGYTTLIGKFYSSHELGIYNRADNIQTLASGLLTDVISKILFPIFSKINKDLKKMQDGMQLALQVSMFLTAPCMIGLAVLAPYFIEIFFGETWIQAVPILQILCVVGIFYPISVINLSTLQAQGHSNIFFKIDFIKKIIGTFILIVGSYYGLVGIAIARVISGIIGVVINVFYTKKFLRYGLIKQSKDFSSSLLISLIMGAAMFFIDEFNYFNINSIFIKFILLIFTGASIYFLFHFLFRTASWSAVWKLLRIGN